MKLKTLSFGFLSFASVVLAGSQSDLSQKIQTASPPELKKLSYEQASKAVDAALISILGRRLERAGPAYVSNLLSQLESPDLPSDKKVLGIYLLGELRPNDISAIQFLIRFIDLKAVRQDPRLRIARWGDYPAEEALIKIGRPAIEPIHARLANETQHLRRSLMCRVLKKVEGKDIAQISIQEMLSLETDPVKKLNLLSALQELRQ